MAAHGAAPAARLVALLRGVGKDDLASGPLQHLRTPGSAALPLLLPHAAGTAVNELLPAALLRRRGVDVDRRGLVLQPEWRSDRQAVELLAARPHGPAHLAVLDLRGPLQAAARHGAGTRPARAALEQLALDLDRAAALVRRGPDPELWLLALGAPEPTAHTIAVDRELRRCVGWPWARELRVQGTTAAARVRATGRVALDRVLQALPRSALASATVRDDGDSLLLLAPPCTAFGRRSILARAPHADRADSVALLPRAPRTTDHVDLAAVVARVAMAAMADAPERRAEPLPTAAVTTAVPLLPLTTTDAATAGVAERALSGPDRDR